MRQQLFREGAFVKYVGYAAGEILLIVAGILIALQINDWAEARKNRRFELETLAQIHENLRLDYAELDLILKNRRQAMQSIDRILAIEDPASRNDDLPYWLADVIHFDRFHSITNAYEVLKSRGLDIIRNDRLRLELGIYYDGWAREIMEHNQDLERSFFDIWLPMLHADFARFEWHELAEPLDQSAFLSNRLVLNTLRLEKSNHQGGANNLEEMMRVNAQLQELIEDEIGSDEIMRSIPESGGRQ